MSRFSGWVPLLACLTGCGGDVTAVAEPSDGSPSGPRDATAESWDAAVGSDADAMGGATELVMTCPRHGAPLAIKLPCLLGRNLLGDRAEPGLHVLECELSDVPVRSVLGVMIPLAKLPLTLNQELRIPFDDVPPPPDYGLTMAGTAIFTEVDPMARTFSARVLNAAVRSVGSQSDAEACTVTDQPLWAVAGDFL